MTRPLTVVLYGPARSPASRLLEAAASTGRVTRVPTTGTNLAALLGTVRRTAPDLVLIDGGASRARTAGLVLRLLGIRCLAATAAVAPGDGMPSLNVPALARAAARPGAGLEGGPPASLVVTVLNEAAVAAELAEAVTGQMRDGDELVLVDGGSTDATRAILDDVASRDPRVRVLSAPGSNISAGRNHGVRSARHDLIITTDAGCHPAAGWLDGLRAAFAEAHRPALVASVPRVSATSALEAAQAAACHPDPDDLRHPSLLVRAYGRVFGTVFVPSLPFARSLAFTRAAWQQAGGFPEDLATTEDGVFGRAVSRHGACVATVDAELTWDQRPSLRATYAMYRGYGEGAARSGDSTLRSRDAVRALAYPVAALFALRAPRRAAPVLAVAGAAYLSLPFRRLARRGAPPLAALLVPVAMVTKDVAKVHGAARGAVAARRRPRDVQGERTRVLVVLPSLDTGGAERHALTVYPALDRCLFDVRLVCIKGEGALYEEARATGLEVTALNAGESNAAILGTLRRLHAQMRSFRPHLVATSGFSADVVGRLAAAAAGVPAIITWKHNCGHVGSHGMRERIAELGLRHLTTRYLAVANAQVDYLTGYLGLPATRITVIHNSVPPAATMPDTGHVAELRRGAAIDDDDIIIGVVAALRSWKGHQTLLRAFRLTLEADNRMRLLVIGDGEERSRLEQLARSLGVAHRVRFLGDRRDVADLLSITDVVVLPSHGIECFPFAILEAMSRGRPAVATDIGGLPELIDAGVTGLLVKPDDHVALAAALLTILQSPDRGAALGRAGYRRLVEFFPFEATVHRIQEEMQTAIAAAAHAGRPRGGDT